MDIITVVIEMANAISMDPRTKVGCVLVKDDVVISAGVNALPYRASVDLNDRALKNKVIVHAEINAVLNSPVDVAGSTAYVNYMPCKRCASALAAYGITAVVIPPQQSNSDWEASWAAARTVLQQRGVTLTEEAA